MSVHAAYHLPGLDQNTVEEWRYLENGGIRLRWPVLTQAQLGLVCDTLARNRHQHLSRYAVRDIVHAIDQTSMQLRKNSEDITQLLSAFTGYSRAVIHETITHMLDDWTAPSLDDLLRAELGDPCVLDHPIKDQAVSTKRIAAYGYPFAFHVFSGNVPGVAVTSLIRSLLVKSATLAKTAAGEPLLSVLFTEQLAGVAPDIASCIGVTYWPGGNAELEDVALDSADIVVVYGGDAAVRSVTERAAKSRLVIHGPRLSFGIVGAKADRDLPRDVARAVAAYDQQGCVSPHVVYVVGSPEQARGFAKLIADELHRAEADLPRGELSAEEAVAIRNVRTAAEFADAQSIELFGAEHAGYSVVFERDPSFKLSCLNRVLYVKPVAAASEIGGLLPERKFLQSAAVEGFDDAEKAELTRLLGLSGVSRVTSFARLPWPPMHWHHDGGAPLRELLTWQDIEV